MHQEVREEHNKRAGETAGERERGAHRLKHRSMELKERRLNHWASLELAKKELFNSQYILDHGCNPCTSSPVPSSVQRLLRQQITWAGNSAPYI